jgi:hypothetical protein
MSWSLTHGFHHFSLFTLVQYKIWAWETNEPGLCPKDPPKVPEQDQPIQNKLVDEESDNFWIITDDYTYTSVFIPIYFVSQFRFKKARYH